MKYLQLHSLHRASNELHELFGDSAYCAIHGAGCATRPRCMFVFMNPTATNVSASKTWRSFRAPWLGTKSIWKLFYAIGGITEETFALTQHLKPREWTPAFAQSTYQELAHNGFYVTNLATCTQPDARPLPNALFRRYLPLFEKEVLCVQPLAVIAFGNQVSSTILGKQIRVNGYRAAAFETIMLGGYRFRVYPVHYPVGQGMRNMPRAIARIKKIISARLSSRR